MAHKSHKRGRSSVVTTRTETLEPGNQTVRIPPMSMPQIVRTMKRRLDKEVGEPTADNIQLWCIQQVLESVSKLPVESLHRAVWSFHQDMFAALMLPEHPRYDIYLEHSVSLLYSLQEHRGSIENFEKALDQFRVKVQGEVKRASNMRKYERKRIKRAEDVDKAKKAGFSVVGDTGIPFKSVLFLDVENGRPISQPDLFAHLPKRGTARDPDSIPEPATSTEFSGFVEESQLKELGFRIYDHGTIYWFARAKDGCYHFVLGAIWRNIDEIPEDGREHLCKFVDFAEQGVKHAFKVEKNWAQNRGEKKHGEIYAAGWHTSMRAEDSITTYAPRPNVHHASDFDAYLEMNEGLKDASDALMWGQTHLFAPRVAEYTSRNLSQLGFPMTSSTHIDFEKLDAQTGSGIKFVPLKT
ncbi:hypothetical protein RhiJN_07363 [Ceratobasidium sp. AG-Ba]|nr:hypothetical protein RhiJN_07363 [Ceratobasidium sp. AG-Ba]QRW08218.1 hypothetical protein RhiLY_07217 [Ceratobasidium sp. AG-Ba]